MFEQAKAYARRNWTTVLIAAFSIVIGASIITFNIINYNNGLQAYQITSEDISEEEQRILQGESFSHTFPIEDIEAVENAELIIRFGEANPATQFDIVLNGEEVESDVTGVETGSEQTFSVDSSLLQQSNTIEINTQFSGVTTTAAINGFTLRIYRFADRVVFLILNLVGILILIGPILVVKYRELRERDKLEKQFPEFLRDVVEGARSGMSLPKAMKNTRGNDYGALNPYVESMRSKLDWGIPFDKVVKQFADQTGSQMIRRATNTIIQSYQSGSNVDEVLDTVGRNIKQVRQLEQQRKSQLYGQIVTGYIVFFVFLGVMVGLINYLVPSLSFSGDIPSTTSSLGLLSGSQDFSVLINQYRPIFRNLVVIQAIFSGLVIGVLSEGELRAGAKHVAILLLAGYSIAALFI